MHPTGSSGSVVRFGVFEADLRSGELRKNGVKIKVQDLPFRALRLLVGHPHEVLSRDNLRQALWPEGVFVDFDRGITSAMNRLRDALGDSADNPVFIETVGRRGYRWIAPTHVTAPAMPVAPQVPTEVITQPQGSSPWWKIMYVLPILALLFAAWIFRAGSHPPAPRVQPVHHMANRDAQDLYLQGRYYWNKRTPNDLNKAVDYFTQAVVHDPAYSDAYVGLADCYNLLREYTVMPAPEAYARALAAARKAVELDESSSEAHASLAFVSFYGEWDVPAADREFRRAIELGPNNAKAHHWYATFLSATHRYSESLVEINRAQTLNPDSPSILADKGRLLWIAGRTQEGLDLLQRIEQAEPEFSSPHRYLRFAYLESSDYPNYLAEMKKEALLLHDRSASSVAEAAFKGFAAGGAKAMFEAQFRQEKILFDQGKYSPYFLAVTCSRMGNNRDATRYLLTAYAERSDNLLGIESEPAFDRLHDDPQFRQLLARLGLPPMK